MADNPRERNADSASARGAQNGNPHKREGVMSPEEIEQLRDELTILLRLAISELQAWNAWSWKLAGVRATLGQRTRALAVGARERDMLHSRERGSQPTPETSFFIPHSVERSSRNMHHHSRGGEQRFTLDREMPLLLAQVDPSIEAAQMRTQPQAPAVPPPTSADTTQSSTVDATASAAAGAPPPPVPDGPVDQYHDERAILQERHAARQMANYILILGKLGLVLFLFEGKPLMWLAFGVFAMLALSGVLDAVIQMVLGRGTDQRPIDQVLRNLREETRVAKLRKAEEEEERKRKYEEDLAADDAERPDAEDQPTAESEQLSDLHPSAPTLRHRGGAPHRSSSSSVPTRQVSQHEAPSGTSVDPNSVPPFPPNASAPPLDPVLEQQQQEEEQLLRANIPSYPKRFLYQLVVCFIASALPWWVPERRYIAEVHEHEE